MQIYRGRQNPIRWDQEAAIRAGGLNRGTPDQHSALPKKIWENEGLEEILLGGHFFFKVQTPEREEEKRCKNQF